MRATLPEQEMNYVRTSARAIIQRGDELLVVRYEDEEGSWYVLPGGGQHHGESLESALLREVEEETGARIRVGPLRFVRECVAGPGGGRSMPAGFHQVELVFSCELVTPPVAAPCLIRRKCPWSGGQRANFATCASFLRRCSGLLKAKNGWRTSASYRARATDSVHREVHGVGLQLSRLHSSDQESFSPDESSSPGSRSSRRARG